LTIQDDITRRSADIHWRDGLTPTDADLFAHNEIIVQAPPQQIWRQLIAAIAWPRWYSNSAKVIVDDPLRTPCCRRELRLDHLRTSDLQHRGRVRAAAPARLVQTAKASAHTTPGRWCPVRKAHAWPAVTARSSTMSIHGPVKR
jgi:hypothetical protein